MSSYPYIRATSSIKSSLIEMSLRLDGTFTVISPFLFSVSNPNCSKISMISSSVKLKPIVRLTLSAVISIGVTNDPKSPCETRSFKTVPEAYLSSK